MNIYEKIKKKAESYEMETAEILGRLIKAPSFSGKEKDVINVIKKEMETIGFDEIHIDELGSIIGRIGNGPRLIAFDAHIDTVYPGNMNLWEFDPFCGTIKDGKVLGRGTSDQKGGMASMLTGAKIIKELALSGEFTVLFTGTVMEEDCDGIAWEHLIKEDRIIPELVISTEPTSLRIHRGHRGRMEIIVEVEGVSCHGSAPERGVNAVYKMAKLVYEIEKLNERLINDPFLGKGTITVSQFKSNSPSQCAVPDYAMIYMDRRLTSGESKELAVTQINECAKKAGIEKIKITIPMYEEKAYTGKTYPVEKYFPTWILEEKSDWVTSAADAYQSLFSKKPVIDKWTFSTNCVFIMGKHPEIKCIGFGPGDEKVTHAPNEYINISDLSTASAFYAGLAAQLNNMK